MFTLIVCCSARQRKDELKLSIHPSENVQCSVWLRKLQGSFKVAWIDQELWGSSTNDDLNFSSFLSCSHPSEVQVSPGNYSIEIGHGIKWLPGWLPRITTHEKPSATTFCDLLPSKIIECCLLLGGSKRLK